MPQGKETKRLPVYLSAEELQLIRVAAAYDGKSMAAYAKDKLIAAAKQTIEERKQ